MVAEARSNISSDCVTATTAGHSRGEKTSGRHEVTAKDAGSATRGWREINKIKPVPSREMEMGIKSRRG